MAIEKTIRIDNEISNRDLVDFDYLKYKTYSEMKQGLIEDYLNSERNDIYKFEINDIQLAVPPLSIGINKESLDYAYKTLRSKSTTKIQSTNAIFHVSITLMFPRETLLQLHRLIIQIRNNPFVFIKNKYLSSSVEQNDYFKELISLSNTNLGNTNSTHFTVFNLQVSNYQQSPGSFLVELDLRYFNHNAYSNNLMFKKELLYISNDTKSLTTIAVDGLIESNVIKYNKNQLIDLRFYKNEFITEESYIEKLPRIKTIKDDFLFSKYLSEKLSTYAVDTAKESNIYVRYYNRLQAEALWNNFGINIFHEETENLNLFEDFGYNDITEWFTRGVDNNQSVPMKVLSLASKYLPVDIRKEIIEQMLFKDSQIEIIYESYHKLNLKSEDLKIISKLLKQNVVFNRNPEDKKVIEKNNKALAENESNFKLKIENISKKKEIDQNDKEEVAIYNLINLIKLSNLSFKDLSFMQLADDFANVMSFVHKEVITQDYEIEEFSLTQQIKPLAITSMSAMISNQIATIPLLGHHYPTHQYLGSTEPKYSMTFIGNSDPDSRDNMPSGIKKIEQIKNLLTYNSNNYKFIPNSNCFALDSFITRLFDSYRTEDFFEIDSKDKRISEVKKRLSMNALNIQTIESLPGMSSGTMRISETNVYDYEKISQVHSSELQSKYEDFHATFLKDIKDTFAKISQIKAPEPKKVKSKIEDLLNGFNIKIRKVNSGTDSYYEIKTNNNEILTDFNYDHVIRLSLKKYLETQTNNSKDINHLLSSVTFERIEEIKEISLKNTNKDLYIDEIEYNNIADFIDLLNVINSWYDSIYNDENLTSLILLKHFIQKFFLWAKINDYLISRNENKLNSFYFESSNNNIKGSNFSLFLIDMRNRCTFKGQTISYEDFLEGGAISQEQDINVLKPFFDSFLNLLKTSPQYQSIKDYIFVKGSEKYGITEYFTNELNNDLKNQNIFNMSIKDFEENYVNVNSSNLDYYDFDEEEIEEPLEKVNIDEEKLKNIKTSLLKFPIETRAKIYKIVSLEKVLLRTLYKIPSIEYNDKTFFELYPQSSVFSFANKTIKSETEDPRSMHFFSFLFKDSIPLEPISRLLVNAEVANNIVTGVSIAGPIAANYAIAAILGGATLPLLATVAIGAGIGYALDQAGSYLINKLNSLDQLSSNYFGVKAYLGKQEKRPFPEVKDPFIEFFFSGENDKKLFYEQLIGTDISKEIANSSFEATDIISELNLKGTDKGLENVFPKIIKEFYNRNLGLAMYPEIRKAFLANAAITEIILPNEISSTEYLGGIDYSMLLNYFWFPTEVDVILNVNDYSTLFKNDIHGDQISGFLVNDEQFESFDLDWNLEQKYLKNYYGERKDLYFVKRLLDQNNIFRESPELNNKPESRSDETLSSLIEGNEKHIEIVKKINSNVINLFRFEYERLIYDLLKDEGFIDVMKLMNPSKYEKLEKFEEPDGIDLARESAYPDIDLPLIPVDYNIDNKLNPGFFYFNQEEDFSDEFAKNERMKKDINYSLNVFKKSKEFMNAMKSQGIYSGPNSAPTLEKKFKESRLNITFDEVLFDMRDEPNSDKIKILDGKNTKITQKINTDVLFESQQAKIKRTDTFIAKSTANMDSVAYIKTPIEFDETETDIPILQLHGTVGQDYLVKYAEEIVRSEAYESIDGTSEEEIQNKRNQLVKTLVEQKKQDIVSQFNKKIKGNTIGDVTSKTDLYSFTNMPILSQNNNTGNLTSEKNKLVQESLRIFKGDDQYQDDTKIIEELGIQAFSERRSIKHAYPTFKFYLIEEDVSDSSNFNVYDDFYSYNGVKDITIYKSRKLAADTAIIRLQNISGTIDGTKRNVYRDVDYEMGLVGIENIEEGNISNNLAIQSVMLRAGVTAQIRLGYDSDPNNLQVMLSGKVTDVMWSSNGDLCEVTIQSFGVELISKRMGTSADPEVQEIPFKDTYSLLGFVVHQSEMSHFGRFKKNAVSLIGENRDSTVGLNYSLDELLVNSTSKSISSAFTSIGSGIAIVAAVTTILLYAFRGRALVQNSLGSIRNFMSGFTPGLRGNTLTLIDDAVIPAAATNVSRIASILGNVRSILTPLWVPITKGLASLRLAPIGQVSRSTALGEYGLFGTLLRMGSTAGTLNLTVGEIILHGMIMPYFRVVTTVAILDLVGVSLVSNFIETTIRSIRYGFNNLIGYDRTRDYFRDKYKTTLVKLSPADDCIYVPAKELYINTDQESRLKYPIWKNLSDYLNKSKTILFDETILGNFTNIFIGSTSWKFSLESENSIMEKQDVDQFIKQVFMLADKRLDVIDASYYYYINNKTSWEILNEMTLRHTGWITGARPYGLGLEYRVFFGRPNDMFFYKEYNQNTIKLLNETISWLYDKSDNGGYNPKTTIGSINDNQKLKNVIPSRVKRVFKDNEDLIKNYLVQNLYNKLNSRKRPFRQYHMLSSRFNLISNNIQINETRHNSVNVKFKFKATADNPEGIFTRNIKLHDNIPDEKINTVDIDFSECKGFGAALRYGVSTLLLETKETYDGEIICIGKPNINPHDICIIEDTYNNIYGGVEVEAVTHMFSSETGYITEIRPNMVCTSNESTTYPILQSQAIFEASKRVVEELKLIPEDLKNETILKAEIEKIIDLYFDSSITSRIGAEITGKANFANNTNLEAFSNVLSQDSSNAISILKEVTTELLLTAYKDGDVDFLSNMSKGIPQVSESVKDSLNKLTKDAGITSLVLIALGSYLSRRFMIASPDTLSSFQINLVSFFSKAKDFSIYTFAATAFANQFGESIIERYLGHGSTFHKITDSLNETNFAKINDGTILQMWPLFKNDKPLVANGIEYIKQNYIWHNRFGEIYNTISDAAYGYINEQEKIKSYSSLYGDQTNVGNLAITRPLKFIEYAIKSRYGVSGLTIRELYTYDQLNPSGLENR